MPEKNLSRDPYRTPMQWNSSRYAGFTKGTPWLRLNKAYPRENVEMQKEDPYSMLSLYRRLIDLRRRESSLALGDYFPVFADRQLLAYCRRFDGESEFLVILNLTHRPCYFKTSKICLKGVIEIATMPDMEGMRIEGSINPGGDEAMIIRLDR